MIRDLGPCNNELLRNSLTKPNRNELRHFVTPTPAGTDSERHSKRTGQHDP